MNYFPFIVLLVVLIYALTFRLINKSNNSRECHIVNTINKKDYKLISTELVPYFSEDNPFSHISFSRGSCEIYKVHYINISNENKVAYVKFKNFSSTGTWQGL